MAKVEYEDEGWNDLIVELEFASIEAAKIAVNSAVEHLRNAVIDKLSGQRSGKIYRVPKQKRFYQASAPGEPPAVMRGKLIQNIGFTRAVAEQGEVRGSVGVDLKVIPYAQRLEFGGFSTNKHGGSVYVAPRPYLRPTFVEQEANVDNILRREAGSR
jgi:hypothetical protein